MHGYINKGALKVSALQASVRSRKLTKQQIICQSANYLSFYKSDYL